jgi:hypothetical protein
VKVEPVVRASFLKLYLRELPRIAKGDEDAVREALGPEAIARIAGTPGYDWLPLTYEVAIVRAVHERHGDAGVHALGRGMGSAATRHAFLRTLIEAMVVMRGRRPETLLQIAMASWPRLIRDAGRNRYTLLGSHEATIWIEEFPEPMRYRPLYVRAAGSVEALLELARIRATSTVEYDPEACRAELRFRWTPLR